MKLFVKPVGSIGTNCYIVWDEADGCAVVDPGAQREKLISFLESRELKPKYILLTHGHYDHIGAAKAIKKEFGCKLAIGANDAEQLADTGKSLAGTHLPDAQEYIIEPDLLVREGDVLTAGTLQFEVFDTPGHTKGGVTYRCKDCLFTGDTLFAGDVGRTDLYGGDYPALIKSVKKLGALEGDYRVLPGHGPESTLETERAENRYMRKVDYDDFY